LLWDGGVDEADLLRAEVVGWAVGDEGEGFCGAVAAEADAGWWGLVGLSYCFDTGLGSSRGGGSFGGLRLRETILAIRDKRSVIILTLACTFLLWEE
jgi:hypothetical protein